MDQVGREVGLEDRIIRAVSEPNADFREDPLRMMEAIRRCCQSRVDVEARTLMAIAEHAFLIRKVPPERIRDELNEILLSRDPAKGFRLLQGSGLLRWILPELEKCHSFEQRNPHHSQDVFGHILTVVQNTAPELKIRWAALLHDVGKPLTFTVDGQGVGHFYGHHLKSYDLAIKILTRLKFDKNIIRQVALLVKEHMNKLKAPKRSTLKRLINRVGMENVEDLLELQIADVKRPETVGEVENLNRVKEEIRAILAEQAIDS